MEWVGPTFLFYYVDKLYTALPEASSGTPANFELNCMNGC